MNPGRRGGWLVLTLVLVAAPAHAIEPGDLTLTVTPDLSGSAPPFAREMVLLKLRGVYRTQILLEEVRQPSLTNFSWTQLGRDSWGRTQLPDGQTALSFERTIAIFPQHTGTFTIEPFTHKLTVNDNGERKVVDVRSEPLDFPVAKWTDPTGGPDVAEPWWLPARDVTITDSWDPDPETIQMGETTRRIVTIEAQGMLAEGMPPRPIMRTRGILTYAGPIKRETILTPTGPVARATYQWDIRKGVPEIIPLNAIAVPWFDTDARVMREAEIPARQIGGGLADREEDLKPPSPTSWLTLAAAAAAAFGIGLALIGYGTGAGRLRLDRPHRRSLGQAARAGDAHAFRAALVRAERAQPDLSDAWRQEPDIAAALATLDRSVYAQDTTSPPDLPALLKRLARPRRRHPQTVLAEPRLAPLDGPA